MFQKFSIGKYTADCYDNRDERSDAKGDIRVKAEAEDEAGKEERRETSGAKSAKEKVERKRENERHHDGAEADAGKVDRPVGKRHEKGGEECDAALVPEFFRKKVDTENGERSEHTREELECGNVDAEDE